MKTDFSALLTALYDEGLSDSAVARAVTANGVKVSQPSITRLRRGEIKHPRYELGDALKSLYATYLESATKQKRRRARA